MVENLDGDFEAIYSYLRYNKMCINIDKCK